MAKYYFSIFFIVLGISANAQEEPEVCMPPAKKVQKLIDKAKNAASPAEATAGFNAAIEADEENATAYFEFGVYAYELALDLFENSSNPARADRMFLRAQNLFQQCVEICPTFHADCYYNLGVISYIQKDNPSAIKWFKAYNEFKHSDTDRYAEDHAKKLQDIADVLGELEEDVAVKTEEVPFEPFIVQNVSTSAYDEYFPMISPDNELMFYTRKEPEDTVSLIGRKNIREFFSISQRKDMVSLFNRGGRIKPPFNRGDFQSYGAATLSVDNKEMIFCGCKKEEVYGRPYMNCDLYITQYERSGAGGNDYVWTEPKNLGDQINTKNGWEGQPSLSADGNTLYFTATRETTRDNDIFVVKRNEDGSWAAARPFDEINTEGKDKSPFLHQDSETLYFVSEVTKDRKGVGGLDIFYIRQKEDGSWTEPKNIGYPINTSADELGLFVSIDGQLAYYSSRQGGNWNIYAFELYEEARPQPVALLKGELKDEAGNPVGDAEIEIAYEGSDDVTSVRVNGDDGRYATIVKMDKKQDVMVTVKKEGHAFDSKVISKDDLKVEGDVTLRGNDLNVRELRVGEAYTINDILYTTSSATLNDRSKFILKGFARFLKENPTIKVGIQGHTDDKGPDQENLELSDRRAQGVKDYLVSLGIDKNRLSAKGFGETQPKVPNTTDDNRAKNRRTDFMIEGM